MLKLVNIVNNFNISSLDSFVVNFSDGDYGELTGECSNRRESAPLNDKTKSLVLINHFHSIPIKGMTCEDNSAGLVGMLETCYGTSGNRWANFVAVDFYRVPINFT